MSLVASFTDSDSERDIISIDGKFSLTVPGDWKTDDSLNAETNISVDNLVKEQYTIVITDSKVDFADDFSLIDFYELALEGIKPAITDATWGNPITTKIGDYDAISIEVSGVVEKIKISYWIYYVETNDNFHQIMGWSLTSKANENEEVIKKVINSFKEV